MPRINSITVHFQTGNLSGAGTDGDVYLGVCGREFRIDSTRDDFERGAARNYVLGAGADVQEPNVNDPRKQVLMTENVDGFPAYIRFQPTGRGDNWQLQRADVGFNGSLVMELDTAEYVPNDPGQGIWLGVRSGLFAHLKRHAR
jgi:hypothetical protein